MAFILGGLNYDSILSSEDYRNYRALLEQAVLSRFLLSAGNIQNIAATTGIVDITNPTQISSSETTRPLLVTVSNLNSLAVSVNAGTAVTPSGAIVKTSGNGALSLARTQAYDVVVVFIENQIIPDGNPLLNDYQEDLTPREIQNTDNLGTALLTAWNNVSLFPPTRKQNIVVLAVVMIIPATLGVTLSVDLTSNTYYFNRPWFSIQATQHQSYFGSGTSTPQNIHAISFNDLTTAGSVSLFSGLCSTGLVVSRDIYTSKMVGAISCSEIITLTRILTDVAGTVTANSPYGGIGASYCQLITFPTRLGSVYVTGNKTAAIAAEVIEGTNTLVFGPQEPLNSYSSLTVEYTEAQALVPPVTAPTNVLTFGLPTTGEVLVSGGLTYTSLPDPTVDLNGSGPFPVTYRAYLLQNGSIVSYPQIVYPATTLSTLGLNSISTPPQNLQQPARLRVGLTKANPTPGMSVTITLTGLDADGTAHSEDLIISTATGYSDELIPSTNYDSSKQAAVTEEIYSSLSGVTWTAVGDTGAVAVAMIQIWAEIEPGSSPEINDASLITTLSWNGQGISKILDSRLVSRGYTRPDQYLLQTTGETLLDAARLETTLLYPNTNLDSLHLFTEDFEDLRFFDSTRGFAAPINATGVITIENNSYLQAGDTITVAPAKVLTAVSSGTPNLSIGQFLIGASTGDTVNNIIATVNYASFNSGVSASSQSTNAILLTRTASLGALGNSFTITISLYNTLALSVSGYSGGFDGYGECYLDRNVIGMCSRISPPDTDLNPYDYSYRRRYRSRACSLPTIQGSEIFFGVEIHGEDKFYPSSVRIRGTDPNNPTSWGGWDLMTPPGSGHKGVYLYTFSAPMSKVQVEYYGKARGLSCYSLIEIPNTAVGSTGATGVTGPIGPIGPTGTVSFTPILKSNNYSILNGDREVASVNSSGAITFTLPSASVQGEKHQISNLGPNALDTTIAVTGANIIQSPITGAYGSSTVVGIGETFVWEVMETGKWTIVS